MLGLSTALFADFTKTDDVVTDSQTQLQWKDDAIGSTMTWQDAIDYCEGLTFAGQSDWRLPNLIELTSLVDDTRYAPSISTVFQNTASSYYWSSTTYVGYTSYAWDVHFDDGRQSSGRKSTSRYVRCVRAGQ